MLILGYILEHHGVPFDLHKACAFEWVFKQNSSVLSSDSYHTLTLWWSCAVWNCNSWSGNERKRLWQMSMYDRKTSIFGCLSHHLLIPLLCFWGSQQRQHQSHHLGPPNWSQAWYWLIGWWRLINLLVQETVMTKIPQFQRSHQKIMIANLVKVQY